MEKLPGRLEGGTTKRPRPARGRPANSENERRRRKSDSPVCGCSTRHGKQPGSDKTERAGKGKEANRHDRSLKRHPRRIKTLSALSLSRHHQKTRAFAASRGLVALFPGLYANATPLALYKDRSLKTKNAMGIFLVCIPGRAGEKTPFGDAYGAAPYFPRRDVAGLSHGERFIGHGRRRNGQSP